MTVVRVDPGEESPSSGVLDLSNLAQRVYDLIRTRILKRELVPGQPLVIADLATQLGVSTSPVRDALKQLQAEDLVVIHPRRGCFVARLTARDVEELCQIRTVIETAAAEMTAACFSEEQLERMTDLHGQLEALVAGQCYVDYARAVEVDYRVHLLIVEALGNSRLVDFFGKLRAHRRMAPELYDPDNQHAQLDLAEHRRIVEAYRHRDPQAARRAIWDHLERVKLDALAHLARYGEAGPPQNRREASETNQEHTPEVRLGQG